MARVMLQIALFFGVALGGGEARAQATMSAPSAQVEKKGERPQTSMSAAPSMGQAPGMSTEVVRGPATRNGDASEGAPTTRYAQRVRQRAPDVAPSWLDAVERAGRVTVRAPSHLRSTAKRLAASAEDALARIATDLEGLPQPGNIEVRLVDSADQLASVAPAGRGAPAYAVGLAYPDLGIVSVAIKKGAQFEDPEGTLRHELAHIALGVALGNVPRWLHEGFAYQHSAEWSWERTETLAGMVWFRSIIPLHELDRSFPMQEMATHRAYAQSYDFVGFLSRRGRWEDVADDGDRFPFRRFLSEIARTGDLDQAAVNAFGRTVPQLFGEWREDLQNRLMFAPVGLFALGIWLLAAILLVLGWARRKRQARATLARWAKEDELRYRPPSGEPTAELGNLGQSSSNSTDEEPAYSYADASENERQPGQPGYVDPYNGESSEADRTDRSDEPDDPRDPNRPPRFWN